ncbi:MAG: TM2 domain-containing protein [Lacibacter sp.]|jgi:TM2 domain-containing membrane protein YozV
MDPQKVDMFLLSKAKYFESHTIQSIREQLLLVDDSRWVVLQSLPLKEPTTALIISILGGQFGIDRFYLGDTGLGIAKLLTCGGFGIWAIVDWFLIMGATREKNMNLLQNALV